MHDLLKLAEFKINMPSFAQPDDVFAELLRHFNIRATEQLLDDPELRQLMLPVIRAEFKMASDYEFISERPWKFPSPVSPLEAIHTCPDVMLSAGVVSQTRDCRFT